MKKVFLVAPKHMNLYQDIVNELQRQKYEVEFLAIKVFDHDPFFVFTENNTKYDKNAFLKRLEKYWIDLYDSGSYSFNCDFLIVINGSAVHPVLFSLLKKNNPNVKFVNYLFDSTQNTYRFDRNFQYYDKIFTFDQSDAKAFHLELLPIYWTPIEKKQNIDVRIFGFGVYNKERFRVFSKLKQDAIKFHFSHFIKVYLPKEKWEFKVWLRLLYTAVFRVSEAITYKEYYSGMLTHKSMEPELFRQYIINSDVIIDTSLPGQDGLTARFMWALGAGKRIITNNKSVKDYPFYSKEQFYIVGVDSDELLYPFMMRDTFEMSDSAREIVTKWRIDNWINTLLDKL